MGWDCLVDLDPSMTTLQLQTLDSNSTTHIITVCLPPDYPNTAPTCHTTLPVAFELDWTSTNSSSIITQNNLTTQNSTHQSWSGHERGTRGQTIQNTLGDNGSGSGRHTGVGLRNVLSQFRAQVMSLESFWKVMADLDEHTWVLEPSNPTAADTTRRIGVAPGCSLLVPIDPLRPYAMCPVRFMGSERVTAGLRENLNRNLRLWDMKQTPRVNLETLLELTFPRKSSNDQEETFTVDCGICYSSLLNEALPERVCDNQKCSKPFHEECLYSWLKALPTSTHSFNTLFGHCPYCATAITATANPE